MKRSTLLLTAALALGFTLNAQPLTQSDLDAAIANAKAEWGVSVDAEILLVPAKGCGMIYNAARRNNKKDMDGASDITQGALAATDRHKGITTSTISFAAGDIDDGSEPALISEDAAVTQTFTSPVHWSNVIRINAACDWSDREFLNHIVMHEYGHAIGILKHSRDDHSIMFWLVYEDSAVKKYGAQSITPADRAAVPSVAAVKR